MKDLDPEIRKKQTYLHILAIYAQAVAEISYINKFLEESQLQPVLTSENGGSFINTFWNARSMREKTMAQYSNMLMLNPLAVMKSKKASMGRPPKGLRESLFEDDED